MPKPAGRGQYTIVWLSFTGIRASFVGSCIGPPAADVAEDALGEA